MGKSSLLKSTSKKKEATKKKDDKTPTKTLASKAVKKSTRAQSAKKERSRKTQPAATGIITPKKSSMPLPETVIDSQQKPLKASKGIEKEIKTGQLPGKVPEKQVSAGSVDPGEATPETSVHAEKISKAEKKTPPVKTGYKPFENECASGPKAMPPDGPSCDTKGSDFMEKTLKYFGVGLAIVFILIIGSSFANMNKYYIKTTDNGIEIWKGNFSPMSKEMLIQLPGVQAPEPVKAFYSKDEIAPFAFEYYSGKAETLLNQPGSTDLEEIKSYLSKARSYATAADQRKSIDRRLAGIDFTVLLYKADIAAGRGTIADIETALGYLDTAALLDIDLNQTDLLIHKMDSLNQLKAEIESTQEEAAVSPQPAE